MISSNVSAGDYTKASHYNNLRDDAVLTGLIIPYVLAAAPTGFLVCDGSEISRVTYADLFAIIGETYGAGDGLNTFNIPDLRGRLPLGKGAGSALGDSGSGLHTITEAQMPAHTHAISAYSHAHQWSQPVNGFAAPTRQRGLKSTSAGNTRATTAAGSHNHGGASTAAGGAVDIEIIAAYLGINFIIKT